MTKGYKRDPKSGNYLSPKVFGKTLKEDLVPVQINGKYIKDLKGQTIFLRQSIRLAQIAAAARGDDVLPSRPPPARAGQDMVEGQFVRQEWIAAILATEAVAQEHVEPGEGRPASSRNVFLEGDHTR